MTHDAVRGCAGCGAFLQLALFCYIRSDPSTSSPTARPPPGRHPSHTQYSTAHQPQLPPHVQYHDAFRLGFLRLHRGLLLGRLVERLARFLAPLRRARRARLLLGLRYSTVTSRAAGCDGVANRNETLGGQAMRVGAVRWESWGGRGWGMGIRRGRPRRRMER